MSQDSSHSSASSGRSEDEQLKMLTLAQIYKKDGKHGDITPWNGREPRPDESIFVYVIFDDIFLRRMVCDNLGDLLKLQVDKRDINTRALYAQVPAHHIPDKIGTNLTLPSYFTCSDQPHCLQECWLQVASFLPKLMTAGKIVMFHPRSRKQIPSSVHFQVGDYKPTFWLNLSDIKYTYPLNTVETKGALKKHHDNGDEFIRQLPLSQFQNTDLYEERREYVPNPLEDREYVSNLFKRRKLGGGQHGGKSRRRLKRRNKRKTIKQINKRNKRKTIKRRF
jgi:hypothetical protein